MILLKNKIYKIPIIIIIFISFTPLSLISKSVEAAIVGSQMISTNGRSYLNREINEKKIRKMLENKIVVEKLKSYGLSDEELQLLLQHHYPLREFGQKEPPTDEYVRRSCFLTL